MKLYKICNKISLLLHALCSAAGYFLIEAISRHSFTDAWTYMTGKPLVFAYNAGLIFTTSLIVYLFRRRTFWRVLVSIFWLLLGIIKLMRIIFIKALMIMLFVGMLEMVLQLQEVVIITELELKCV